MRNTGYLKFLFDREITLEIKKKNVQQLPNSGDFPFFSLLLVVRKELARHVRFESILFTKSLSSLINVSGHNKWLMN